MRVSRSVSIVPAVLLLVMATACTSGGLDDGDGADVVLQMVSLQNDPVTAQLQGQAGNQTCTLEVVDWTGVAGAAPLSEPAGEGTPFNDIILYSVTIEYDWIDDVATTPTRVVGLGNIVVPVGGTNSFSFAPLDFQALTNDIIGQTANLTLTFRARTTEGEVTPQVVSRQLFVEACPLAP